HGEQPSVIALIDNAGAELSGVTLDRLAARAVDDATIAEHLATRTGSDWPALRDRAIARRRTGLEPDEAGTAVYNVHSDRFGKPAGFSPNEWIVAQSQVRAMNDRRQLDFGAVARLARFGYGHHVAAALAVLSELDPGVF